MISLEELRNQVIVFMFMFSTAVWVNREIMLRSEF